MTSAVSATSIDLNRLGVPVEHSTEPQRDHGMKAVATVEVIFRGQRERLIAEIRRAPVILGCVAWLTDRAVLEALSACTHVSIIVQKEDFLRPDLSGRRAEDLCALYARLPSPLNRYCLPGGVSELSYAGDPSISAIRCVGNHNRERRPAWPRMHNKFLVFCDVALDTDDGHEIVHPRAVWTGSYNISYNAAASWENAVLIGSAEVAAAYSREFAQILAFSERLDWTSDWVEPEYRIGS
jgi:hypothetical protein